MWTVQATWTRSPSPNVDHYDVRWYLNGALIIVVHSEDCESTRDGFIPGDVAMVEVSAVSSSGESSTVKSADMTVGSGGGVPEPPGDITLNAWKTEEETDNPTA